MVQKNNKKQKNMFNCMKNCLFYLIKKQTNDQKDIPKLGVSKSKKALIFENDTWVKRTYNNLPWYSNLVHWYIEENDLFHKRNDV